MVHIDVWSDIACPWCWLGHAHLRQAAKDTGIPVEVTFRSYQLAPHQVGARPVREHLLEKYGDPSQIAAAQARLVSMGSAVGLAYDFDAAVAANTFDAHRLHHFALAQGHGDAVMERLFQAQHRDGQDVSDRDVLVTVAADVGLDRDGVAAMLASGSHAHDVQADVDAARELGVRGVPFFVFERRHALAGAQPIAVFIEALRRATDA